MEKAKFGKSSCSTKCSECAESKAVLTNLANQIDLGVQMSVQRSVSANEINKAIAHWLRTLTDQWTDEIDGLKLSSTDISALSSLRNSGLVEEMGSMLVESDRQTIRFEQIRIGCYDEQTFKAAMSKTLPGGWLDEKGALKTHCTISVLPIFRARLTADGVEAKADLLSKQPSFVFTIIRHTRILGQITMTKREFVSAKTEPQTESAGVQNELPKISEPQNRPGQKSGIPIAEVNVKVREILKSMTPKETESVTCQKLADEIGCSKSTVSQTGAWKAIMEHRVGKGRKAKEVSMTDGIQYVTGVEDEELPRLIEDQTKEMKSEGRQVKLYHKQTREKLIEMDD